MSQLDPCSVVRIAIALAALKHKPRDQSATSYLLDLHSHFPLTTKDGSDDLEWRTYALELEKQLAALKAQRDADQELLSKLRTNASQVASTSDGPPPKKKGRKNTTKGQHDAEWSWDQSRADWSRVLSSQYPSSPSLIAAYTSLEGVLDSSNADPLSYASRLTDAILRALNTIHIFLFSATSPNPGQTALGAPLQLKSEYVDSARIALASPLLMYVLRTGLRTLVRTAQDSTKSKHQRKRQQTATTLTAANAHTFVDKVVDRLLECVLLFLLRALAPLCSARLAPLLSPSTRTDKDKTGRSVAKGKESDKEKRVGSSPADPPKKTDPRTDVFALIGTSLEALDALPPFSSPTLGPGICSGSIASGVRDRLGLETIHELEALYATPLPPPLNTQQPPATPSEPPSLPPPGPSSTPLSAHSQSYSQPCPRPLAERRAAIELRAQRLERLAGTRAERVKALATRDAGWFLVSTLNLCATPALAAGTTSHDPVAGAAGNSGGLLREALLDRIGKLVRYVPTFGGRVMSGSSSQQEQQTNNDAQDDNASTDATNSKFAIDQVCQNMLLATCERAMSRLAPS